MGYPRFTRDRSTDTACRLPPAYYPTSIILPLHPLLKKRLIHPREIFISSTSGVSGAGRSVKADYLYAECNASVAHLGVPTAPSSRRDRAGAVAGLRRDGRRQLHALSLPHHTGVHTIAIYTVPRARHDARRHRRRSACGRPSGNVSSACSARALPDTKHVTNTNFIDAPFVAAATRAPVTSSSSTKDRQHVESAATAQACYSASILWPAGPRAPRCFRAHLALEARRGVPEIAGSAPPDHHLWLAPRRRRCGNIATVPAAPFRVRQPFWEVRVRGVLARLKFALAHIRATTAGGTPPSA